MPEDVQVIQLGAATITIVNVGHLPFDLDESLSIPPMDRPPRYAPLFAQPLNIPVQCVHIKLPGVSVLVDAAVYEMPEGEPLPIPDYRPPPGLLARLAEAGVQATEITHVVITHSHFDHYNGLTVEQGGVYMPRFPNARCYVGSADWEQAQLAMQEPTSLESRTLAVLRQHGLLEPVTGDRDLGEGLSIIAAPGETDGHQIVRVHSEGQTLYCLGDLYHHPIEVEQPIWMVMWASVAQNVKSRTVLAEHALAEHALLIATHIPGVGRLERSDTGVVWHEAER